jgi:hypothetical protein
MSRNKLSKQKKRLDARIDAYHKAVANDTELGGRGYRKPGSNKK